MDLNLKNIMFISVDPQLATLNSLFKFIKSDNKISDDKGLPAH